jgi:predicted phosphoribosyltransferase
MRRDQYTRTRAPIAPAGGIAIIVDDGMATGRNASTLAITTLPQPFGVASPL